MTAQPDRSGEMTREEVEALLLRHEHHAREAIICACDETLHPLMRQLLAEREAAKELWEWLEHSNRCILSFNEAGEPTEGGGYRTKYAGKWYQTRPVDETPKCTCGLDDAYALYRKAVEGKEKL